jgi:hypothetical protein
LRRSSTATAAWTSSGQSFCTIISNGSQRDHFSGDLGEPFGAAADGDEAVVVDRDDVAGIVPVVFKRFENARFGASM